MINYYNILGLTTSAGIKEIKAAFRHLAKLYHPDVNPNGKEEFSKILKAYETLSNARLKPAYDRKLHSQNSAGTEKEKPKQTNKHWRFDERELKRRQYYNEHIKQYEKKTARQPKAAEDKATYNEFKYILFATPLAVILFLGIMSLASKRKVIKDGNTGMAINTEAAIKKTSDLQRGDAPYTDYFGSQQYDASQKGIVRIKNLTGSDLVVCLFDKKGIVRNFFIASNFSAEISQLPPGPLSINYASGLYFDSARKINRGSVQGGFTQNQQFYKSLRPVIFNSINELTLLQGENEGFRTVDEIEFFRK